MKNVQRNMFLGMSALLLLRALKRNSPNRGASSIGALSSHYTYFTVDRNTTLESLRKQFSPLAQTYHPDRGGDEEVFKIMHAEYEEIKEYLKKHGTIDHPAPYSAEESDFEDMLSNALLEVINTLAKYPSIVIEIKGTWIWVSGNTYSVREILKSAGFRFAPKKKQWSWHPANTPSKRTNRYYSPEELTEFYGSKRILPKKKSSDDKYLADRKKISGYDFSTALARLQNIMIDKYNRGL